MLAGLLSFFLGGGLKSIEDGLVAAYQAKLNAANDAERIAADQRIATLQAQRDVMVGASGKFSLDAVVRFLFALGPLAYFSKIFLIDKVWCSLTGCAASTDPLSPELTAVAGAIIGFYFLYSAVKG